MESNDIAQYYANLLQKNLKSGNYESFKQALVNEMANSETLQLVNPSVNEAAIKLSAPYNGTPGMLPLNTYTGEIAFRVVRVTSNINAPLPVPFGSAFAFSQNYMQVLESLLAANTRLDSVTPNIATNSITFVYSNGADTDQVIIYGDTYNYIAFNQGLYTRRAMTNTIRYTTPDNSIIYNQVSSTPSRPFKQTWLSNSQIDRNTLTLTPMQYNKNVFDIIAPTELSEEKGFALYAFGNTSAPSVALTYTVQMFFDVIGKI